MLAAIGAFGITSFRPTKMVLNILSWQPTDPSAGLLT